MYTRYSIRWFSYGLISLFISYEVFTATQSYHRLLC
ncbi:MAG: YSIRK-type signal peptide-containing protein [Burkholderiaceae bacterium]